MKKLKLDEFRDEKGHALLSKPQRDILEGLGVVSVELLAQTPLRAILENKGIGETKAMQVLKRARETILAESFVTALEWQKRRKEKVETLKTGSMKLDTLLGGGFMTEDIYEVGGPKGSGKTQVCIQLCANAWLPKEKGGLAGDSVYVDTEGNFKAERLLQMAKGDTEILKHVHIAPCYTSDHQALLLDNVAPVIEKNGVRLIVVDSLIVHFRSEFKGREDLAERQQLLGQYLMKLHRLARAYNLLVVYSNQAIANPVAFGPTEKETGGNILGHQASARLWIRQKGHSAVRIARLTKSPWLPEGEALFRVSENGIEDVEDETEKEEEKTEDSE